MSVNKLLREMSEAIVENQTCKSCGSEIRKGALFCYNCGCSLVSEVISAKSQNKYTDDATLSHDNKTVEKESEKMPEIETATIEKNVEVAEKTPVKKKAENLKTAASLRKKNKTTDKKQIEIVWNEHENPPNALFLLATILMAVFAVCVVLFAFYFR